MTGIVEAVAVACGLAIMFGVPFGFFAYVRFLRHKEAIAMIEQGMRPQRPARGARVNGYVESRWPGILIAVGIALTISMWPIGFMIGETPLGLGPWLLPGVLPLAIGLMLRAQGQRAAEEHEEVNPYEPVNDPVRPEKNGQ